MILLSTLALEKSTFYEVCDSFDHLIRLQRFQLPKPHSCLASTRILFKPCPRMWIDGELRAVAVLKGSLVNFRTWKCGDPQLPVRVGRWPVGHFFSERKTHAYFSAVPPSSSALLSVASWKVQLCCRVPAQISAANDHHLCSPPTVPAMQRSGGASGSSSASSAAALPTSAPSLIPARPANDDYAFVDSRGPRSDFGYVFMSSTPPSDSPLAGGAAASPPLGTSPPTAGGVPDSTESLAVRSTSRGGSNANTPEPLRKTVMVQPAHEKKAKATNRSHNKNKKGLVSVDSRSENIKGVVQILHKILSYKEFYATSHFFTATWVFATTQALFRNKNFSRSNDNSVFRCKSSSL